MGFFCFSRAHRETRTLKDIIQRLLRPQRLPVSPCGQKKAEIRFQLNPVKESPLETLPLKLQANKSFILCAWRDSNPHAVKRQILSLVRLPITPHAHALIKQVCKFTKFLNPVKYYFTLGKPNASFYKKIAKNTSRFSGHFRLRSHLNAPGIRAILLPEEGRKWYSLF